MNFGDPLNLFDVLFKDGFPKSSPKLTPLSKLTGERSKVENYITPYHDMCIVAKEENQKRKDHRFGKFFRHLSEDICEEELMGELRFNHGINNGTKYLDVMMESVPYDLVVVTQRPDGSDYVSFAGVHFPDAWNAESIIGRSFREIHQNVRRPNGMKVIPGPERLVTSMINSPEPLERIGAVVFKQNCKLNHHKDRGFVTDFDFEREPGLFLRFERQVILPMPEINSFGFLIYTYFVDCTNDLYKDRVLQALDNLNPGCFNYEKIVKNREKMRKFLKGES